MDVRSALLVCAVVVGGAVAQSPHTISVINGTPAIPFLGGSVCALGDIDGDGIPDFATSSGWDLPVAGMPGVTIPAAGRVDVRSGATGAVIFTVTGSFAYQALGATVVNVGDVDGDGRADIAIGAPMFSYLQPVASSPPPQVQVWSTGTHQLLYTLVGGPPGYTISGYGLVVAGIGDVASIRNGVASIIPDGVPDIVVTARLWNSVYVYSGADGTLLYSIGASDLNANAYLVGSSDQLGISAAGVGDVDGDGMPDFVLGAQQNSLGSGGPIPSAGMAFVLSGVGGALIGFTTGTSGDHFGRSLTGIGDVDNDGVPDFAGCDNCRVGTATQVGSVRAVSGATRAVLWRRFGVAASDQFGSALAGGGDINRDGVPDVIVGTSNATAGGAHVGSVTALDGRTGAVLGVLNGVAAGDALGAAVAVLGDIDGDGSADVLVSAPLTDVGGTNTGSVSFISFGPFLRPSAAGDIPAVPTGTFDMLTINGSAGGAPRRVDVGIGQPFTLAVGQPPAFGGAAGFYAFAYYGLPGLADEADPGYGVGTLCFLPPAFRPADPHLFVLADSLLGGDPAALIAGASTAPWSAAFPAGLPFQADIAVQAVTLGGAGYLRSNAVLLSVR